MFSPSLPQFPYALPSQLLAMSTNQEFSICKLMVRMAKLSQRGSSLP